MSYPKLTDQTSNNELLANGLDPRAWRKFQRAQRNFINAMCGKRTIRIVKMRKVRKWAREFNKWSHRIFITPSPYKPND